MSVIKILVVEDEVIIAEDLATSLEASGYVITACVDNGKDALRSAAENPPDLVFMDINIAGDMDGIQTAAKLKEIGNSMVIFVTNLFDNKTIERANVVKPANYLVKPFTEAQINASIQNALYNTSEDRLPGIKEEVREEKETAIPVIRDDFFIKVSGDTFKRYHISEFLYIEAARSYCYIHLESGEKIVKSTSMGDMALKLVHAHLMRVSRSFIVNISKIDAVKGNLVIIRGKEITVSKEYMDAFRQSLNMIR
jgi:DNA-binding LytR/AlgR family response regulator